MVASRRLDAKNKPTPSCNKMRVLFLFLDGIGLGDDDSAINPFAVANTPTLLSLTNGKRWLRGIGRQKNEHAIFIPTDPRLGIPGRPQSGTSQAAILTGLNVPEIVGRHYGPKPDEETRTILDRENLFLTLKASGKRAALLDAYPPRLLQDIERGKTLPSSIQYAARTSQELFTIEDLKARRAITAEWTGKPWHTHLKLTDTPLYTSREAGHLLVELAYHYDFAFHSHWMTDYFGHRGPFEAAVELLETFDEVLAGVLEKWDDEEGLIIVTSDHGNMEHIGDRKHTENDVPTLLIGKHREMFGENFTTLMDFTPRILRLLETD